MSVDGMLYVEGRPDARGRRLREYGPAIAIFVLATALWEALIWLFNIQVYLLPAPHIIAQTFLELSSSLLDKGLYTFREALSGGIDSNTGLYFRRRSSDAGIGFRAAHAGLGNL